MGSLVFMVPLSDVSFKRRKWPSLFDFNIRFVPVYERDLPLKGVAFSSSLSFTLLRGFWRISRKFHVTFKGSLSSCQLQGSEKKAVDLVTFFVNLHSGTY